MSANLVSADQTEPQQGPKPGRFHTTPAVKYWVWMRAAGHCELCGVDLTRDFRIGSEVRWGEVAHILPASSDGPRAEAAHTAEQAKLRTNDPTNLMLLCPNCHEKVDKDADGYPTSDLSGLHEAQLARIALAAASPTRYRAVPMIVLSRHFATINILRDNDLLAAMSSEGLFAVCKPVKLVLPEIPISGVRDQSYWRSVSEQIQHLLSDRLSRATPDSADLLALAGLADIPALVMVGQTLGDRMPRMLFSPNRATGLLWPSNATTPSEFQFSYPPEGDGPVALVVSLSAKIPSADVLEALPNARIAEFSIAEPNVGMVENREVIDAFRSALQKKLSDLEAAGPEPIHLFLAIPAVLAIEMGALLTTQHRHTYEIYDRGKQGAFERVLTLDHSQKEIRP